MNVRSWIRRLSALAIVVCLLGTGVEVHVHSMVSTELWRQESGLTNGKVHDIACAEPTALHWHADHAVEVEPCLACLRNHFAGLPSTGSATAISAAVSMFVAAASARSLLRVQDANSSRGPPDLLS